VRIFGEDVDVRAEVVSIDGYSAHADRGELQHWVQGLQQPPRVAFAVHGEAEQTEAMAGLLRECRVSDVRVPTLGQTADL